MLVQCPSCSTTYRVSDGLISVPNPTFRCSRCKHIFILGLTPEPSPARKKASSSSTPKREEEIERELSFSFPPSEAETTREREEQTDSTLSDFQGAPPAEEPVLGEQELSAWESDISPASAKETSTFRMAEEKPAEAEAELPPPADTEKTEPYLTDDPFAAAEREHPAPSDAVRHNIEPPPASPEETQPSWTDDIAATVEEKDSAPSDGTPKEEEPPATESSEEPQPSLAGAPPASAEESRYSRMEGVPETDAVTEVEWQTPTPPLQEMEAGFYPDSYRGQSASTVPYFSLFGALLLIYSLFYLTYQTRPKTAEAFLQMIPGLGSSVLENNHLRQGIALRSLRPGYQTILGNRKVLVISGVALNRNPFGVRKIRVEGNIYDSAGKTVESQDIWVGNAISPKIIGDLTAQEISILQKLSPQKKYEIAPEESAKFVIVFLKPKGVIKDFSCRVLSAEGV